MWRKRFASSLTYVNARRAAFAIAMGVTIAAMLGGVSDSVENELRHWRDSAQRSTASGTVAVLEIDGRSLQAMDTWPWPRSTYADALTKLDTMGAAQIAFDVDFSSRANPAGDQVFAEQLAAMGGDVILPTFRQINQAGGTNIVTETVPLPEFARHAFLASVNVHPRADGQVAFYPYGVKTSGTARPSLASMVAGKAGNIGHEFRIDQTIDPGTIPRISFIDLLEGRVSPEQVSGRNIIIGATAIELGDRYPTGHYGVIPGVLIQAQAAETLLQDQARQDINGWLSLAFALGLFAMLASSRVSGRRWSIAGLMMSGVVTGLAVWMDMLSWAYWPLAPALVFTAIFLIINRALRAAIKLRDASLTDGLSGLPNRQALIALRGRLNAPTIAVARIADIQQIEAIIPAWHLQTLDVSIAERMAMLAFENTVFRLDRGLFGWIVPADQATDLEDYFASARAMFNAPVTVADDQLKLVANFGVGEQDIGDAVAAAEHARHAGLSWSQTTTGLQEQSQAIQKILLELDDALENGAIWVAYQPKYRFADKTISGAECLIRWDSPVMGRIGPDQFIPVLESKGRMHELTLFVLRDALDKLSGDKASGQPLNLAINVSAQLLADTGFVDEAVAMLNTRLPQANGTITIEITESAPLSDPKLARLALDKISAAGARISIDDYGTGQATLTYLQDFPANEVKLDQSFVRNFTSSKADEIMVRSTIELAHALDFEIVAEGIEEQEILDALEKLGCDYGQGWHIGRPVPWDDFFAHHCAQAATTSALTATA